MRDEQEDKVMRSLLLPLGKQSARAPLAEATCEDRMQGARGLPAVAVGKQAEAVYVRELVW